MNLKVRERARKLLNLNPGPSQGPKKPDSHSKLKGFSPTHLINLFGIHLANVNKQYHKS